MKSNLLTLAAVFLCLQGAAFAQTEQLQFAVIVSRHGVRSPTWAPERLNQYSAAAWPTWGVGPGLLTAHGRMLMKTMGGFYRDHFAALLNQGECADKVYFRADSAQRTLETARALAEGMLPGCQAEIHAVAEDESDPLFDGTEAGTGRIDAKLALAAVAGRLGPEPQAIVAAHKAAFDELVWLLSGNGKAAGSILQEPLGLTTSKGTAVMSGPLSVASTLSEDLLLEYADGMSGGKLGWGRLTAANLLQVMSLHIAYADLMRRTPYLARTRGSNLLSYVLRALEEATQGKARVPMVVIAGHDTNLSNLSGMLGLSWILPGYQADDTPPGGALLFTLWKSRTGGYSVRLQYVAQTLEQMHDGGTVAQGHAPPIANIFVPGCSAAVEGYACEWEAFRATARGAILPEFVGKQ